MTSQVKELRRHLTETQTNSLVEYFCENLLNYFQKRRENGIDAKN